MALLVLFGCGAPATRPNAPHEPVTFTAERSAYHPGDTVLVVLRNRTHGRVGYNLCFSDLERRTPPSNWSRVIGPIPPSDPETGSMNACPAISYGLTPEESAPLRFPLPDTLSEGVYRITTGVTVEQSAQNRRTLGSGRNLDVATDPFAVQTP